MIDDDFEKFINKDSESWWSLPGENSHNYWLELPKTDTHITINTSGSLPFLSLGNSGVVPLRTTVKWDFVNPDHPIDCSLKKATDRPACYDLVASHDFLIRPGYQCLVGTNIRLRLPEGWEAQIRPRSGLGSKGLQVHWGTIDEDYEKELKVLIWIENEGTALDHFDELKVHHSISFKAGDRIAQIAFRRIEDHILVREDLTDSTGRGGFGSTGV